jgi:hypothetical protein
MLVGIKLIFSDTTRLPSPPARAAWSTPPRAELTVPGTGSASASRRLDQFAIQFDRARHAIGSA